MTAQEIIEHVRALPCDERADLIDQLIVDRARSTFDESVAEEWTEEIRRRVELSRSGQLEGQPWEVVRDDLRRRLAEGRNP